MTLKTLVPNWNYTNKILMYNLSNFYNRYLELGKDFSNRYPQFDSVVFSLLQSIDQRIITTKKRKIRIKYFLFPLYVFSKYYHTATLFHKSEIPSYPDVKIAVIIFGSGPQHYGDLIKIVDELVKRNQKMLIIYGSITSNQENYLKKLPGIYLLEQNKYIYKIGIFEFTGNIFKSFRLLKNLFKSLNKNVELSNIFKEYKGFLLDGIFISLCYFKLSKKIIENNSFKFVFSSSDGFFSRGYFINANTKGIENFILQHGFLFSNDTYYHKTIAQKIVVWFRHEMDAFIKEGFPKKRLLPLGLPRFDDLIESKVEEKNNIKKLCEDDKLWKVCFFTSLSFYNSQLPFSKDYMDTINDIAPKLKREHIQIFLRVHPSDNLSNYQHCLSKEALESIIIIDKEFPMIQFIKQMNLCVLTHSTATIECMLCKIPTIFINFNKYWNNHIKHDLYYYGLEVLDKSQLFGIVMKMANDSNFRFELMRKQNDYINKNILNPGMATKNIADYILNCI